MAGNGYTDRLMLISSYYDVVCTPISLPPVLSIEYVISVILIRAVRGQLTSHDFSTCVRMKLGLGRCEKWFKESCRDQHDEISCGAALSFCDTLLLIPLLDAGKSSKRSDGGILIYAIGINPYDLNKMWYVLRAAR